MLGGRSRGQNRARWLSLRRWCKEPRRPVLRATGSGKEGGPVKRGRLLKLGLAAFSAPSPSGRKPLNKQVDRVGLVQTRQASEAAHHDRTSRCDEAQRVALGDRCSKIESSAGWRRWRWESSRKLRYGSRPRSLPLATVQPAAQYCLPTIQKSSFSTRVRLSWQSLRPSCHSSTGFGLCEVHTCA